MSDWDEKLAAPETARKHLIEKLESNRARARLDQIINRWGSVTVMESDKHGPIYLRKDSGMMLEFWRRIEKVAKHWMYELEAKEKRQYPSSPTQDEEK